MNKTVVREVSGRSRPRGDFPQAAAGIEQSSPRSNHPASRGKSRHTGRSANATASILARLARLEANLDEPENDGGATLDLIMARELRAQRIRPSPVSEN
jgi:hypothetical protein